MTGADHEVERLALSERTRLRRMPERAVFERSVLDELLDAALICHLGVVVDDAPLVVPTSFGRLGDVVYLHGSVASRSLRFAQRGVAICVTVTHVDGLVLARSVFEHSMNYRCAVIHANADVLAGDDALEGLRVLTEHVAPGQWDYARRPSTHELAQTRVLRIRLDEASVKIRRGPPDDGDSLDGALGLWAGEIPLRQVALAPVTDPACSPIDPPNHVVAYASGLASRLAPPAVTTQRDSS